MLDDISDQISKILPHDLSAETRKKLHALLESYFSGMGLVTREEFDVQKKVLLRTREKVEVLQQRLSKIEDNLQ